MSEFQVASVDTGARAFFNAENAVQLRVSLAAATPNVQYAHDIAVVRVEFRKMMSPPFHEFLVFHVEEQSPRHAKAIIIAERFVASSGTPEKKEDSSDGHELVVSDNWLNPQPRDSTSDLQPQDINSHPQGQDQCRRKSTGATSFIATSSYASSLSSAILASFIPKKPSFDLLTFVNLPNNYLETLDKNELCKSFSIPKHTFSVSQLAVLANVVHEHHQSYDLLEFQCFWYAAVIYNTILWNCQRKHRVEEVELPAADRLGKFGNIHVKLGRLSTTAEILKKYEKEWKVTHKKIEEYRKVGFDSASKVPIGSRSGF